MASPAKAKVPIVSLASVLKGNNGFSTQLGLIYFWESLFFKGWIELRKDSIFNFKLFLFNSEKKISLFGKVKESYDLGILRFRDFWRLYWDSEISKVWWMQAKGLNSVIKKREIYFLPILEFFERRNLMMTFFERYFAFVMKHWSQTEEFKCF